MREGRGRGPVAVEGTMGQCSGVQVYNDSIWGVITVFTRGAVLAGVGVNYDCLFWCCLANYPDHLHNEDVDNVMFAEHIILEYTF